MAASLRLRAGAFLRRRGGTILRVVAAATVIVLVILWQAEVFTEKTAPGETERRGDELDGRETVVVESLATARERDLLGALRARTEVRVAPRIIGRIVDLPAQAGDRVRREDVLARLDREALEAGVSRTSAAAEAALSRLRGAEEALARIEAGFADDVASEIRLIEARQRRDEARARAEEARESLRQARIELDYATIRSPIDGVVIDRLAEAGDLATPGQPIVVMFDPDRLEAEVSVPSSQASRFTVGARFAVEIEALGVATTGVVRTLVPLADARTRAVLARLDLEAPPGSLPGMFVRLRLKTDERDVLAVPASAIGRVRQLDFVWIVDEDNRLRRRFVRSGDSVGEGLVEVLSGLSAGDRVAARWSDAVEVQGASGREGGDAGSGGP